jgi:hypothetical protein
MEEIPGLIIESVVPGITGGGEKAFRREQSGHQIPLEQRFGGWHVTGTGPEFPRHWGNMLLVYTDAGRVERPIAPGELFNVANYPATTSDILPHLLHEHQVGFDNRAIQAIYRTRASLHRHGGKAEAFEDELDAEARALVRYLLLPTRCRFHLPASRATLSSRRPLWRIDAWRPLANRLKDLGPAKPSFYGFAAAT